MSVDNRIKVTLCRFFNNVCLLSVKSLFLWSVDEKVHICGTANLFILFNGYCQDTQKSKNLHIKCVS